MNIVFLMDPLETVVFEKDTSYALMLGAARRGHEVFYLPKGGIDLASDGVRMRVEHVTPHPDPEHMFERHGARVLRGDEVDAVFIRTDPPFDADYLMHTWLLDQLPAQAVVVNRPTGIRTANEKLWAMHFAEYLPETLISRNADALVDFVKAHGKAIAKPSDGFGGKSVFQLREGDTNTRVAIETLTAHETQEIIVQAYVEEASLGDKRILLLNGEILGAVLRVHGDDDHRNNFFAGGRPEPTEITDHERHVIEALAPKLRNLGLYFVGIDFLGDRLIEVNVTSPTCLQEMNRIDGVHLEDRVITFVEDERKCRN